MSQPNVVTSTAILSERKRTASCRAVLIVVSILMIICAAFAMISARNLISDEMSEVLTGYAVVTDAKNRADAAGYQATIDEKTAKIAAQNALSELYAARDAASESEKADFSASIAEAEAAVRVFFATDEEAQAAYGNLAAVTKKDNSALTIATNKLNKLNSAAVSFGEATAATLATRRINASRLVTVCIIAIVVSLLLMVLALVLPKFPEDKRKAYAAVLTIVSTLVCAAFIVTMVYSTGTGFTKADEDVSVPTSFASIAKQVDKADMTLVSATAEGAEAITTIQTYRNQIQAKDFAETLTAMMQEVAKTSGNGMTALTIGLLLAIVAMMSGITMLAGFIQVRRIIAYALLAVLTFLSLFFFYLLLINCTRTNDEIISGISLLPGTNFKANWDKLMAQSDLPVWYGMANSLFISLCTAALSTYVSALTAYAIHAYDFKFKKFAFNFILLIMMIPTQVSTLGFLDLIRSFGWTKGYLSYLALIVPSMAAPTVFFFMKQYMDSALPLAIVEAARIDGCSEFGTFNRIVLPIMKPAIAVQAIFCFVNSWNNYFTPALVIDGSDPTKKTLPILIAALRGKDPANLDQGMTYMMIALSILPVIVVYLCLSKFIIRGVALGGVKE